MQIITSNNPSNCHYVTVKTLIRRWIYFQIEELYLVGNNTL
jgi:hypothetical protein